jgi:hypothetical protein
LLRRFIVLGFEQGYEPHHTPQHVTPSASIERDKRRPPLPIPPRLMPHLRRWRHHTARYLIEWQGSPIASQERRAWRAAHASSPGLAPTLHRMFCATLARRGSCSAASPSTNRDRQGNLRRLVRQPGGHVRLAPSARRLGGAVRRVVVQPRRGALKEGALSRGLGDEYTETGPTANLTVDGRSLQAFEGRLQLALTNAVALPWGTLCAPTSVPERSALRASATRT